MELKEFEGIEGDCAAVSVTVINTNLSVESRTGVVLLRLKCRFFPVAMLQQMSRR
jgi:hypothetical protein